MLPRQPATTNRKVSRDRGGAWIFRSAGEETRIRTSEFSGRRPRKLGWLSLTVGGPHDMARLAKWRLNRCVFDIVTFFATQQVSMP